MTYMWQINIDYQNNSNIVVNDSTSIILSMDEIVYTTTKGVHVRQVISLDFE